MEREKLGIMGGTFDPIHNGHLIIAENIRKELNLKKVFFIPAYIPPHKINGEFASAKDRYNMVELAIKDYPNFAISDMEIKRTGVSYTYDTIKELYDKYGKDYDIFFIVGADSVPELKNWHRIKDIFKMAIFVAARRPGFTLEKEEITFLKNIGEDKVLWVNTPSVAASSTDIRNKVKYSISIDKLVPRAVAEYIRQKDLYRR